MAQQGVYFVIELSNLGQVVLSVKSFFVYKIRGETTYVITALSLGRGINQQEVIQPAVATWCWTTSITLTAQILGELERPNFGHS